MTSIADAARILELEEGLREAADALKTYEAMTKDLREQLENALRLFEETLAALASVEMSA